MLHNPVYATGCVGTLHMDTFEKKLTEMVEWNKQRYKGVAEVDIKKTVEEYKGYAEMLKDQICDTTAMMQQYKSKVCFAAADVRNQLW